MILPPLPRDHHCRSADRLDGTARPASAISTDVAIANGMLAELKRQRPEDLDILVLPTQEIGKANEHIYGPGTLSLGAELLIPVWTAIGAKVAEAGIRKMVIVNSHGGNLDIMSIVARELRVRYQMAVVSTQWARFGTPEGMISDHEQPTASMAARSRPR